jgi:predicted RNA methylase
MPERPLTPRKALGAYYTAPAVVDFLVDWGLATAPGVVMDPACGDGRFLIAAAGRGARRVIGCDLDDSALVGARRALASRAPGTRWYARDFFLLEPAAVGPVDLILGNPPYIRYQRFAGESRSRALASALRVGARLSRLSASWAPFLLHALQFLRDGGAMGMVVPAELAQTAYGVETLRALCAQFACVRLLTFRHNWFEDAQQETFLLLAESRGGHCSAAELMPLGRIEDLHAMAPLAGVSDEGFRLQADGGFRLGWAFLDAPARELYQALHLAPGALPVQSLGEVANGYVSGANAFFHCTRADAEARGLPDDWLLPVARNSRSLRGLAYVDADLASAEHSGTAHHLILPREGDLFASHREALDRFVAAGAETGISGRYKCRVRNPWWRVPGLIQAELLLPYMIGREPHAAVNRCHALYPNSLHGIRLANPALAERIAFGLLTSYSLLSMELEGRSYGGGVLKLEPSEMQRVRLILPSCAEQTLTAHFDMADQLIRAGDFAAANRLADQVILHVQIGLSESALTSLAAAREVLVGRRWMRSKTSDRMSSSVTAEEWRTCPA